MSKGRVSSASEPATGRRERRHQAPLLRNSSVNLAMAPAQRALDLFPQFAPITNNFDMAGTAFYSCFPTQAET
jgi:hypothetical protein